MKLLLSAILSLCFYMQSYSQKMAADTYCNCTKVISDLSYYWKLDSLANNGFRLYTYDDFLDCKIDKVDRSLLLDKLGRPSEIRKTSDETEYLYYYFDIRTMPRDFEGPAASWYISFRFDENGKYLRKVEKGDIDRY